MLYIMCLNSNFFVYAGWGAWYNAVLNFFAGV